MPRKTIDDVFDELKDDPVVADAIAEGNAAHEAGRLLREMRAEAGMSQRDLAESMGVAQARISEIENPKGPNGPSYRIIREAAKICGFRWPSTIAELERFDTDAAAEMDPAKPKASRRRMVQKGKLVNSSE